MDQNELGERVRDARRAAGLTQMALAERLGVPLGTVERLENGLADPTPFLDTIAQSTDSSVAWLRSGGYEGAGSADVDRAAASLAEREKALARVEARVREAGEALEERWAQLRQKEAKDREAHAQLQAREEALAQREQLLDAAEDESVAALERQRQALETSAREAEVAAAGAADELAETRRHVEAAAQAAD